MGLKKLTRRNLPFQSLTDNASGNGVVVNRGPNPAPAEPAYPSARPEDQQRINQWIGELPGLMRELKNASEVSPEPAFWFLTTWGRLTRLHPCLLPMPEGTTDVLSDAQALVEERGGELVRAAARRKELAGWAARWVERAAALERSYEEADSSSTSRLHTARVLLNDLDDLDLVRYAAQKSDVHEPGIEADVAAAYQFIAQHADGFLAAADDCRRTLSFMRADLPSVDRALARTALKYMRITEAADRMHADLSFADHAPLDVELRSPRPLAAPTAE